MRFVTKKAVFLFCLFLSVFTSDIAISKQHVSTGEEVKYAGFAFAGKFKDIAANFKYSNGLAEATRDQDGRTVFDRDFLKFFKDQASSIKSFPLIIGGESETKISMALALTRESVSVVQIDDVFKIVINLGFNLLFLDFESMSIRSSYPIFLEYIDAQKAPPQDSEISECIRKLLLSEDGVMGVLRERLPGVILKNDGRLNMRVANVVIEEAAAEKLGITSQNMDAAISLFAQRLSNILSSKLGISVLPYAKDYLNARMSLVFSDSRVQDFAIPPATYALDFTLNKFTKDIYKENAGEDAYLYGVYAMSRVYDPELGRTFWDRPVKYGIVKSVPNLQKTFDEVALSEDLSSLIMLRTVEEMKKDKKFSKEVISRCANK